MSAVVARWVWCTQTQRTERVALSSSAAWQRSIARRTALKIHKQREEVGTRRNDHNVRRLQLQQQQNQKARTTKENTATEKTMRMDRGGAEGMSAALWTRLERRAI